jgi:hypothetical protein
MRPLRWAFDDLVAHISELARLQLDSKPPVE